MNKEKEKLILTYFQGIEDGLNWVGKDMPGSAGRLFDIHRHFIFEYIKQVKILLNEKQ